MGNTHIITAFTTSFFTFQILFHLVSSRFSSTVCTGFSNLSPQKKTEWNSRVVSTVHSLVVGALGLYILFFDESKDDPLWGESSLVDVNISIASGYLFSDLMIILLNWKIIGDIGFVLHHCTALYAYAQLLSNGVLRYVGNYRLLAELSSPFVNQRWFFEVLQYPKFSRPYIINGVLMMVMFFIVRIAAMPPSYYFFYSVYGTKPYLKLGRVIQYSWIFSCLILDVMNIMWMMKISKGCIKMITLFRNENAKNRLQNGKLN